MLFCFSSFWLLKVFRSNRPDVLCKKGGLRNSAKFLGKQVCQSVMVYACIFVSLRRLYSIPLDTRCKLNVYERFTLNPVSRGIHISNENQKHPYRCVLKGGL